MRRTTIPFPARVEVEEPSSPSRTRYGDGWRNGRPVEDPEKTKSWGFVTAKPSEYLIHMRRGKVRPRSSGQGSSCFKLPWDSVAVIPTTITRLQFTADQVTREKVGVEVTGLAVYRITDPEMTYKMLNFSFAERAHEKLESTLREMFMGSVRRIVANMEVEEVLTRRKDGLAEEIIREIQPIISGRGRENDRTNRGWGVVIDTIEIQNVRVLSEKVFANMQAAFRNALALQARSAELVTAREIAEGETRNSKEIAEARIAAEAATREMKAVAEARAAAIELAEHVKQVKGRGAAEKAKIEEKQAIDQAALQAAARLAAEKQAIDREAAERRIELEQWESQARIERERLELDARMEHERQESETRGAVRERELELDRLAGESANALTLGARQIENLISDEALRRDLVAVMPSIADAFAKNMGEMRFMQIGGSSGDGTGPDPLAFISRAFAQVIEVAKASGLDLGGLGRRPPPDDSAT